MRARAARVTKIADGRYSFELPSETRPEALITELASAGASLVSVMQTRTTLEDVFLKALGPQEVRSSKFEVPGSAGGGR